MSLITVGVIMLAALTVASVSNPNGHRPPLFDLKRGIRQSIETHAQSLGYIIVRHFIPTQDDYYLLYHQLAKENPKDNYLPILLQHGLLSSSSTFMAFKFSLAFLLADQGFDVWMGNARGNMYSRKHSKNNPDKNDRYWEFSFHEMGKYDLPAGIDYILSQTKKDQLYYVGFSMGTTMYFVMGATRPEYMPKIKAMIALAPVVRPKNMALAKNKTTFFLFRMLYKLLMFLGFDEMFPYSERRSHYTEILCNPHPKTSWLCRKLLGIISNQDNPNYDESRTLGSLNYFPAGTSVRTMDHFLQIAHAGMMDQIPCLGKFQQYDFGRKTNLKRYGSTTPPEYDLKKVTSPVFLVWGEKDTLSVEEDVRWLMDQLPTKPKMIATHCTDFCHDDFMYGKNAEMLLNRFIVDNILEEEYRNTRVEETKDSLELVVPNQLLTF